MKKNVNKIEYIFDKLRKVIVRYLDNDMCD